MTSEKPITNRSRAFKLDYRFNDRMGRTQGGVQEKVFWHDGPLRKAVEDAREHCNVMNYTYIYCSPFIVDLKEQESLKSKFQDYDTPFFDETNLEKAVVKT